MRAQVYRIGFWMLMVLLAACHRPAETRRDTSIQSSELLAVDSLLWTQPDSALTCLMACYDTIGDRHYANLLLAELLYKNDYEQTNRAELQVAVAYYDSVSCPFLAARAHYINGVGYYERDSVVPACEEYLKAVEIMEGYFTEKELVGQKAKFMALTYTRLYSLFSNQYLHEQAICFGKTSLAYYHKYNAPPRHMAWVMNEIGSHYDMMEFYDSADYYYEKGLTVLSDTNNLTYRDIVTRQAFLSYKMGGGPQRSVEQLQQLIKQAKGKKELMSRYAIVGEIFYHEKQYDSAAVYLDCVFRESSSIDSRKQAAEWLVEICKHQGENSEEYADFLVPYANKEENKSNIKSQLVEKYNHYKQQTTEQRHQKQMQKQAIQAIFVITILLLAIVFFFVLYRTYKRKKLHIETKFEEEKNNHEIQQKALSGRLKHSNEELRIQKKKVNDYAKKEEIQQRQIQWDTLDRFIEEDICQYILTVLRGRHIKREAKSNAYPELRLSEEQLHDLSLAVEKHFCGFEKTLTDFSPKINRNAMNQCRLYLLNLEDVQIAALLSCDYSTVTRRSSKLKKEFHTEKEPRSFIQELVS